MNFAHQHVIGILVGWWIFSAVISALPMPLPTERWYQFIYAILHGIAGSLARILAMLYPQAFKGATVQTDTVTVTKTTVDPTDKPS